MDSMDSRLKVVLFRSSLLVDGSHVIDSRPGLSQFHISLLLAPVCRVQQSTRLLQFSLESIGLSLSKSSLLSDFHLLTEFFLQERFSAPQLSLVTLDRLVSFRVGLVGVVKSNFQPLMSASNFFLILKASALARDSASREACMDSMARWWFLRVLSNSSSFSWILRSISWRTWPSSSWARRTLFSSCSRAASASSRAAWSSSFSTS